jgi:regulator of replication initiation timing
MDSNNELISGMSKIIDHMSHLSNENKKLRSQLDDFTLMVKEYQKERKYLIEQVKYYTQQADKIDKVIEKKYNVI